MFTRDNSRFALSAQARYVAFATLMILINMIDGLVVRSVADLHDRLIVAIAASFDVIAVVTAIYYFLLVRPAIRTPGSMIPIALFGLMRATYLYPGAGGVRTIVTGLGEVGIFAFVVAQFRQKTRLRVSGEDKDLDPLEIIRTALNPILPVPAIADFLTAELAILYYALFSWRAKPHVPLGALAFSIHKTIGQAELFALLPIACVLEIVPMHLALRHWSPKLAFVATGLSVYGMVWLVGLSRSFRLRPTVLTPDFLHVRYGLLFQLTVAKDMIVSVRRALPGDKRFAVPRKSEPTVCIQLTGSISAKGLFGIRKSVTAIAVTPDNKSAFEQALAELAS